MAENSTNNRKSRTPRSKALQPVTDYGRIQPQAPELEVLPFVPQQVSYSLIGDLAQVQYRAGEDTVTCRKAPGQADISGDYQTYAQTEILEIGGIPVTVRGDGGLISLATWTDGDFSFSLASSQPLAPDVWTDMLSDIIGHGG